MLEKLNDKSDFLSLIQANKRIIFKICNAYCQNKYDREDLAQEMIYQLWKSRGNFNSTVKLSTWMYRVSLNVAISFYRRERKTESTSFLGDQIIEIVDEDYEDSVEEHLLTLQNFISELKELDRALMLLYLEEKPHKEIAEIMGISVTNVATKIGRIKEQLKQKFSHL
ncbi:MAG: sigma-70 family RNA polymerase sigma factor [Pedobacter sp.]|nr:MAG: sigma-70 family RNA polymerase sigma factor [Pedobacter sp.]